MTAPALLAVEGLTVGFRSRAGLVRALDRVAFDVRAGEMVGLVGESGAGKSAAALAVMGLLGDAARIEACRALFGGRDLLALSEHERAALRGRAMSMAFQSPLAALNPIRAIGLQIADVLLRHDPAPRRDVEARVVAALARLRIADPQRCARALPQELSGGMRRRVELARALACRPKLLIADEPTAGLDPTTQAAVMDLLRDLTREAAMGCLVITHDLALAGAWCDRIFVMHAGQIVEAAPAAALFAAPRHPFTRALLAAAPAAAASLDALTPIDGEPPDLSRGDLPPCRFAERCARRAPICDAGPVPLEDSGPGRRLACRRPT